MPAPKVSVVVPVYNPGDHIDDCIRSLLEQTLPREQYELIFVDDGSTDGTPARLDALAAEHPHVRVAHIPNSGWPSRPRNVGLDLASGEYVLFVDNDDWLGREALARLTERADEDRADVVVGKVVGHGKSVPRVLFARNRREVALDWGPLWGLLSPHKLFRRSLLDNHTIRFPEDRRYLEDHAFVVPAYFHAERISILADYPCYHWVLRDRDVNAATRAFDAAAYFASLERVLDLVVEHTEPGEFRDWLLAHWYRGKMLGRVGGLRFTERPAEARHELAAHVRRLMEARFPPAMDAYLPLSVRARAALLRAGEDDALVDLARIEATIRVEATVTEVDSEAGAICVGAQARLLTDDGPLRFERRGDRVVWLPPAALRAALPEGIDATEELERNRMRVLLRSVADLSEFLVPATTAWHLQPSNGGDEVIFEGTATIAPRKAAAGKGLDPGAWHLRVEARLGGFHAASTVVRKRLWGPLTLAVSSRGEISEMRMGWKDLPVRLLRRAGVRAPGARL